jgi:hypothetical protein
MKNLISTLVLVFFAGFLFAQNISDLLLFNNQSTATTARSLAVAGTVPGADWGSTNPAGFGLFDNSQTQISGGWRGAQAEAKYFDQQKTSVHRNYGELNSVGMIFVNSGFGSHLVFGVGYNRLSDFRRTFAFEGEKEGSIISWMYEDQMDPTGPFGGPFAENADRPSRGRNKCLLC